MANLLSCLGSCETNHSYRIMCHGAHVGDCQFIQNLETVVEVQGQAKISVFGVVLYEGTFDIIVSVTPPVLTVGKTPDPQATLNGCTIQAHSTLKGHSFSVSPDGQNTKVDPSGDWPDIEIEY
jgi:hypothetical protein